MKKQKSSWNKSPVSQLSKIILGGTPKRSCSDYWKGSIYWATPSDINLKKTRYLDHTKEKITKIGLDKSNTKLLPKDGIIITARGTVGELCMLSKSMAFNQSCYGLVCNEKINNFFLFYSIKASIDQVKSQTYGAVFDTITIKSFDNIFIPVPPLPIQLKIASILSAYDDLIENNLRRINILEEMAQLIYREWFVHYRFPGHEKVKMVDSPLGKIPEGWEVIKLSNIATIMMGQSPSSNYYNDQGNGLPFHQGVKNFGSIFPVDQTYCTIDKKLADKWDILVSVRAPVGRINIANKKIVIGRGLSSIRHIDNYQVYLYFLLKEVFKNENSMGSGTIYNAILKKDLHSLRIINSITKLIDLFEKIVKPMFNLIENYYRKNIFLQQTRDLLLPKLISGEIDVSDLEIDTRRVEE